MPRGEALAHLPWLAAASWLLLPSASVEAPASVHLGLDSALAVTSAQFLGVNIDTASLYQGTLPHRLQFEDPTLISLATGFAKAGGPGTNLRVGGSTAEDTVFGTDLFGNNHVAVDPKYWDQLVNFAAVAGFDLVYDLNAMGVGSSMRVPPDNHWNSTNAAQLLRHVARLPHQRAVLKAVQLGNEPGHYAAETAGAPTAAQHGRDYRQLKALLASTFGTGAAPLVQGPDVCFGKFLNCSTHNCTSGGDKCANLEYFDQLLVAARGSIDEVTVHNYGVSGPSHGPPYIPHGCTKQNLLNLSSWEPRMLEVLHGWRNTQARRAPNARLILSETATSGDGGCVNMSNTFLSGFFWVDQLGLVSAAGYWKTYRQDLVGFSGINGGSSYALAGPPGWVGQQLTNQTAVSNADHQQAPEWPTGPLTANPDYFTSLLWKALMGPTILSSSLGASARPKIPARVYASCAREGLVDSRLAVGVSLAFVNPSIEPQAVSLPPSLIQAPWMVYVLTADSLTDARVRLNGKLLGNADADASRLVKQARVEKLAQPLWSLPPRSYGFVVVQLPRGAALACE